MKYDMHVGREVGTMGASPEVGLGWVTMRVVLAGLSGLFAGVALKSCRGRNRLAHLSVVASRRVVSLSKFGWLG